MSDLTATEKAKVKLYLGYPRLETRIDTFLIGFTPEEYLLVQGMLAKIEAALDAQASAAVTNGPYKRIEEVEFNGMDGAALFSELGTRLCKQLADFLGVTLYNTPFGKGGITSAPICRG